MLDRSQMLREEMIKIPTYEMGDFERLPVYQKVCINQGTKGALYPFKNNDRQTNVCNPDHEYRALILENEYIRVTVLPELGGRIYEGYDKVNDYNFVYKNNVIKPSLITLNGAWISGGIEFNWPQHHRPTTFLPLEYTLTTEEADGSMTAWVGETEPMLGLNCVLGINMHPNKSYVTAKAKIYNPTTQKHPFHWWANLAVHCDESYRLMFPPDIDYVTFHNRTHVSEFPVIAGAFGNADFGEGVDVRSYKNVQSGISVFIFDSQYSFMSGYSDADQMGTVHVADKYISPGKKFFTWGHSGSAVAWEHSLTDADGPYLEIMTGCYSDNQPDFTWIMPQETKTFEQRWFSIHGLPDLKNATKEGAMSIIKDEEGVKVQFNVTEPGAVTLTVNGVETAYDAVPCEVYEYLAADVAEVDDIVAIVANKAGIPLVAWKKLPMFFDDKEVPEPRQKPKAPADIEDNDELYANGMHLEQYKSPLLIPDPYYLEILKRNPDDLRANTAMATLKYRRGQFEEAIPYLQKAIKRVTCRNTVPYDSDCYYQLGLVYKQLDDNAKALPLFKRAAWQYAYKSASWYQCAEIEIAMGDYEAALEDLDLTLEANGKSIRARGIKAALLARMGKVDCALAINADTLAFDKLAYMAMFGNVLCGVEGAEDTLVYILGNKTAAYIDLAESYASAGMYPEALKALSLSPIKTILLRCYQEYCTAKMTPGYVPAGDIDQAVMDEVFPNRAYDYKVLQYVMDNTASAWAPYFLGCLCFNNDVYDKTIACWQLSIKRDPNFVDAHRAMAAVLFEGYKDMGAAEAELAKAYELERTTLIVFEYYQLLKVLGTAPEKLVSIFEDNIELAQERQELIQEYLIALNGAGRSEDAADYLKNNNFYTYEGGEGITSQIRTYTHIVLGNKALAAGDAQKALDNYIAASEYPENLHEGPRYQLCQSHRLYHVAKGYKALGDMDNYAKYLQEAMDQKGTIDEAEFYRGIAFREAGDFAAAAKIFNALKDQGSKMIGKNQIEFFLNFPTPLPYERDQARFMDKSGKTALCLGCIGLRDLNAAKAIIAEMKEVGMPVHWLELALSDMA